MVETSISATFNEIHKTGRIMLLEVEEAEPTSGSGSRPAEYLQGLVLANTPSKTTKYLLGFMACPWTRRKARKERQEKRRLNLKTERGTVELSWEESGALGFRQLHSDSEGKIRT